MEHSMNMQPAESAAAAGITRGVARLLRAMGFEVLEEFKLTSRRRADVAGLDKQGRFVIVEVKSSLADFRADAKWPDYLAHCDAFYFAVAGDFPLERLPAEEGLIVADAFDATIQRPAAERPMNGNRRRTQILRFARQGARQLAYLRDPGMR
ncbi:MAG: MmcB family DNA repair protein [Rhodospirillaceae bacterium]